MSKLTYCHLRCDLRKCSAHFPRESALENRSNGSSTKNNWEHVDPKVEGKGTKKLA
jgi:hypothetical protein